MLRHTKENENNKRQIIYGYLQRHVPVLPSLKTESSNHEKKQTAPEGHPEGDLDLRGHGVFLMFDNSKSRP